MAGRVEVALDRRRPRLRDARAADRAARPGDRADATGSRSTLALSRTGVALTQENVTTRYNVTGIADYALVPLAGGPPVAGRHRPHRHRLQRAGLRERLGLRRSAPPSATPSERLAVDPRRPDRRSGWRCGAGELDVKLAGRDAARFLARPDPRRAGDPALRRRRHARGAEARRAGRGADRPRRRRRDAPDPHARRRPAPRPGRRPRRGAGAIGFFPGPRAVLVEEAGDAAAPALAAALDGLAPGRRPLVVTAGSLGAGSALRKAFEAARQRRRDRHLRRPARPRRDRGGARRRRPRASPTARPSPTVEALAQSLDPGDFAQFLDKLALYKHGDPAPLSAADIAACAPPRRRGRGRRGGRARRRRRRRAARRSPSAPLGGRGGSPTGLTIAAGRYFRTLHAAAFAADGPDAALARARPPVFGPRRARMAAQARALGRGRAREGPRPHHRGRARAALLAARCRARRWSSACSSASPCSAADEADGRT